MKVLGWGCILYIAAFVLHLAVWKIRVPGRQVRRILQIKFATLAAGLTALYLAASRNWAPAYYMPEGAFEYMHIALFFISATLAYMITYSAIEADSPSLVMVMAIDSSNGLEKKEFMKRMNDDVLVKPRVRDLVRDSLVRLEGGRYATTPKGALTARIFILYRSLLGLGKGG